MERESLKLEDVKAMFFVCLILEETFRFTVPRGCIVEL